MHSLMHLVTQRDSEDYNNMHACVDAIEHSNSAYNKCVTQTIYYYTVQDNLLVSNYYCRLAIFTENTIANNYANTPI